MSRVSAARNTQHVYASEVDGSWCRHERDENFRRALCLQACNKSRLGAAALRRLRDKHRPVWRSLPICRFVRLSYLPAAWFHFAVVQSAQTLRPDLRQRNSRRARTRKFRQNFVTSNQITVCRMNARAREFRLPFAGEGPQPDYRYKFGAEGFRPKSAGHSRHHHRRVVQCESLLTLR